MALIDLALTTTEFAGNRGFGQVGPYEQLRGTATFAIDPRNAANQSITDLDLAPRDADGRVRCTADVRVLRPADHARSNRTLLLDVVNRGNPIVLRGTNREAADRGAADDGGSGWLLAQGYTIVCCGWQHDVPRGTDRFGIAVPEALVAGEPVAGRISVYQQFNAPCQMFPLVYGDHVGYPVADVNEAGAVLIERDYPLGPQRIIPRDRWTFAWHADQQAVSFPDGFVAGRIYEVVYTTRGAPLTGLGLAATRDWLSFLRFAAAEQGNPCAGQVDHALAFGASQSGRFLRQMVHQGFCGDEHGRLALDGILSLIGGPIRGEANLRFGQPGISSTYTPGFQFPFTDIVQTDPASGRTDGLLRVSTERGLRPRIMYVNSSAEYTNQTAALIHLSADGTADAPVPDNVRIYHFAGTQHGGGSLPLTDNMFGGRTSYYNNSVDYRPLVRAALENLRAWVADDREPPPSQYPRLADGTLVDGDTFRAHMARLPGRGMPAHRMYPTIRLDYGPELIAHGRSTYLPPLEGAAYPDLLPAVDDDGNLVAGVRHPDVEVPLATYTGWNPRHPALGGSTNVLLNGATIPFARTRAARVALGDHRASIAERWSSLDDYLARLRASATALVDAGYLLAEDVESIVETGRQKYVLLMELESPLPAEQVVAAARQR